MEMIYYSIPWSTKKNIGTYYNRFMGLLPHDSDFGCFLDGDACFTTSDFGQRLELIVAQYPDSGMFAAMTNRIGAKIQIAPGVNQESNDIKYHRDFGTNLALTFGTHCKAIDVPVSGVMMLLRKSTWWQAGGFAEHGMLGVDWEFCRRLGEKVMLMQGIYVYHWYRNGDSKNVSHLC